MLSPGALIDFPCCVSFEEECIWDVATLSAQTLDFMQMLLSAYKVHTLFEY